MRINADDGCALDKMDERQKGVGKEKAKVSEGVGIR